MALLNVKPKKRKPNFNSSIQLQPGRPLAVSQEDDTSDLVYAPKGLPHRLKKIQ